MGQRKFSGESWVGWVQLYTCTDDQDLFDIDFMTNRAAGAIGDDVVHPSSLVRCQDVILQRHRWNG